MINLNSIKWMQLPMCLFYGSSRSISNSQEQNSAAAWAYAAHALSILTERQ